MTDLARRRARVYTALWFLVLLSLVVPENLPALAVWGRHTLFFPAAVLALVLGLFAVEGRRLFWPPRTLLAVDVALALALVWIAASAFVLRDLRPPPAWGLVAADAVRVAFVVAGLETLRRLGNPVPRLFALLVPLVTFLALAILLRVSALGVTARAFESLGVRMDRVFTGIGDPNFTSLVLVAGLGGAFGFVATARRAAVRVLALLASVVLVGALVRTVSLGGLAGFLALLLGLLLGSRALGLEARVRRRAYAALAILVLLLATLGGGYFWTRIRSEWKHTEARPMAFGAYRLGLFVGGVRMLAAHPWAGVGPGRVPDLMPRFVPHGGTNDHRQTCHDFLVGLGDESGLVPMLVVAGLLAVLLTALFRRLLPLLRRGGPGGGRGDPWGVVVTATLLATLLQALALPAQRDPYLWLVVILAAAHLLATASGGREDPAAAPLR